ncbi:MAG: hypothetical protein GY884_05290 [Proteobacteria bacterium]|nr:hypothetical protein [Pseudomonadota bacterium]
MIAFAALFACSPEPPNADCSDLDSEFANLLIDGGVERVRNPDSPSLVHCDGAAAFATSLLDGDLRPEERVLALHVYAVTQPDTMDPTYAVDALEHPSPRVRRAAALVLSSPETSWLKHRDRLAGAIERETDAQTLVVLVERTKVTQDLIYLPVLEARFRTLDPPLATENTELGTPLESLTRSMEYLRWVRGQRPEPIVVGLYTFRRHEEVLTDIVGFSKSGAERYGTVPSPEVPSRFRWMPDMAVALDTETGWARSVGPELPALPADWQESPRTCHDELGFALDHVLATPDLAEKARARLEPGMELLDTSWDASILLARRSDGLVMWSRSGSSWDLAIGKDETYEPIALCVSAPASE